MLHTVTAFLVVGIGLAGGGCVCPQSPNASLSCFGSPGSISDIPECKEPVYGVSVKRPSRKSCIVNWPAFARFFPFLEIVSHIVSPRWFAFI